MLKHTKISGDGFYLVKLAKEITAFLVYHGDQKDKIKMHRVIQQDKENEFDYYDLEKNLIQCIDVFLGRYGFAPEGLKKTFESLDVEHKKRVLDRIPWLRMSPDRIMRDVTTAITEESKNQQLKH